MKHKSPSELNTKTIRINLGDYLMLTELSHKLDLTMAEAFTWLLTRQGKLEAIAGTRAVLPHARIPITTGYQAIPITAIATNGNKAIAFRIKPKGARYD